MTIAIVLFFLFSGLLWLAPLISDPMGVLFWRGGAYSDLLISHWPNAAFVRHSLTEWGQIPMWNPMILSGAPFAADPLSGLYYPLNWLAVAMKTPGLAFNLLAWLHVGWGGMGMWRLTRALGYGSGSAIVAGLAFAGMPKLIGHFGLGHISLVFAVYWTPWILLAFDRAVLELRGRRFATAALAGSALGLVFLIDPRWFLPAALLSFTYSMWRLAHSHNKIAKETWIQGATSLVVAGLMSLAIAAILAVPLAEFVSLSTRASLSLAASTELSLPLANLRQVLTPEYSVWPEWQIYAGIVVLFLASVTIPARTPGRWYWFGVFGISLVVALGDLTPFYGWISAVVPGFSQLRVPPRSLFLSAFALAILAGMGVDQIINAQVGTRQLRILGAGLGGIALALALGSWLRDQDALQTASAILSAAFVGLSVVWAGISFRTRRRYAIAGWCVLIVIDLGLVNLTSVEVRPSPELRLASVSQLSNGARVYSPSYSLQQPVAAAAGLELADGINPLQIASYVDYMSQATGSEADGYSVTLPPFPEGDPMIEWGFKPDSAMMGNLAISSVVSAYPLPDADLELERMESGHYFYRNPHAMPRAWVEGAGETAVLRRTPNQLVLRATGPGRLITSEIVYPGWEAEIDGVQAPIEPYDELLRSVQLGTGDHEVRFEFRSNALRVGALITLLSLLVLASLWIRR